jgi:hypothetical protein
VSERDRLGLTPNSITRDLWKSMKCAKGNENFVYSSLWDFKSSFTCHKILRHGTFPLSFPSERKVCCGFLSPLKIHRLGWVLNPQPLCPVASTLTTTPPRRLEGEDSRLALWPPPVDDKATTNYPGYIIFNLVTSNIKTSYTYKTQRNKRRKKALLLFVNAIQNFRKAIQMCERPYIQAGHGTQLSKSVMSQQNRDVWGP